MVWLFLLAIPIACISWTVTHEEVFREPREYCVRKSEGHPSLLCRKFYYLFTCEYCFSHYVTVVFLLITRYKLLYDDWRGYLISLFSLVFVANFYIGAFGKVKLGVKKERVEIKAIENEVKARQEPTDPNWTGGVRFSTAFRFCHPERRQPERSRGGGVEGPAVRARNSSRWLRESVPAFCWQVGYGAFSVSPPQVARVVNYIHNQERHHRRMSFEDEIDSMLRAAAIQSSSAGMVGYRR